MNTENPKINSLDEDEILPPSYESESNMITIICAPNPNTNENSREYKISKDILKESKYFQSIFMLDNECKAVKVSIIPEIFENVLYFLENYQAKPFKIISKNDDLPENENDAFIFSPLDKRYYMDNLKGCFSKIHNLSKSKCYKTMECSVYLDIDPLTQLLGAELAYRITLLTDDQYDEIKQNFTEITDWLFVEE